MQLFIFKSLLNLCKSIDVNQIPLLNLLCFDYTCDEYVTITRKLVFTCCFLGRAARFISKDYM